MEKSYTEFDRNWARNVENTCKYDANERCIAFYKPILKYITWVQDQCMEKSYTEWSKYGKIRRKYQQISTYTWVNYSSQCPYCNENNSNSRVLYGQIIYPVLSKHGRKRRKHQHFIHLLV